MVHDPRVSHQLARLGGVYRDPSRVDRDASTLLKSSAGMHLQPIIAVYSDPTVTSTSTSTVLVLQGTIAMHFRGATYQLLIDMYLLGGYPVRPPVCYVRLADSTMYLKPNHKHVGSDGKVYLPYLHEWSPTTHNLIELVVAMSSVFSADPPVFSRPPTMSTTTSATTSATATAVAVQTTSTTSSSSTPIVTGTPIQSSSYTANGFSNNNNNNNNNNNTNNNNNNVRNGVYTATASTTSLWNSSILNTSTGRARTEQEQYEMMVAKEAAEANAAADIARRADAEDEQRKKLIQLEEERQRRRIDDAKRYEEARLVELRVHVQNKIRYYCNDRASTVRSDITQDWHDSNMLNTSEIHKVQYQLDLYKKTKTKLLQQLDVTKQRTKDIEIWLQQQNEWMEQQQKQQLPIPTRTNGTTTGRIKNIDTVVVPISQIQQQMLDLAAENAALHDVLYFLDRALYSGDIDCMTHIKHVRNVAKKQFFIRALLIKIQQQYSIQRPTTASSF